MHRYTIASAFALMAVIGSAATAAPLPDFHTPKPNLPDLSVVYIERNPKFPGTIIEWHHVDEGPNGNKGDAANSPISNPTVQKWPTPGQTVTFTAHVKNKGPVAAPRFDWHFLIDGKDVDGGETAALAPGAETTYEIKWKWLTGDHWVSFEVDRAQVIDEISKKNNFVVDQVNAMGFHFFVQKDVYDWFDTIMSAMLSYSWEDWAQFQVREMNRTFRDDIYPAAPDGIKMRVRIDQITILPNSYKDPDGTHAPIINATGGCDGVWGFTNSLLQKNKDTGKNVYEANPELIFAPEWSLLHELGHQLGQPDYYCMPIPKEHNKAAPGMPYSPGHGYQDIMMFSGNWSHASALGKDKVPWNSTYRFWGEHSAASFNRDLGVRRGFFANFLVDIPAKQSFNIVDEKGKPLANARVELFRSYNQEYGGSGWIPEKTSVTGKTDSNGVWPLDASPYTFVSNWTANAALFFRVTSGSVVRYGWMNITDFNLEYWRGHKAIGSYTLQVMPREPAK